MKAMKKAATPAPAAPKKKAKKTMARWKAAMKTKKKFLAALSVVGAWACRRVLERREEPPFSREELAILCGDCCVC